MSALPNTWQHNKAALREMNKIIKRRATALARCDAEMAALGERLLRERYPELTVGAIHAVADGPIIYRLRINRVLVNPSDTSGIQLVLDCSRLDAEGYIIGRATLRMPTPLPITPEPPEMNDYKGCSREARHLVN